MYERILVPLDGSQVGEAALSDVEDLASKLAPKTQVEIILLQVISDITFDYLTQEVGAQLPYNETDMKKIKKVSQTYLSKLAKGLKDKGFKVTTMVSEGHAADEIKKAAQKTKADLIAMSTHGRSGFRRWAMGSITDKVLQDSSIPVLTVRARQKD
jgi:nucleotide-binding universal stress UspA family protein